MNRTVQRPWGTKRKGRWVIKTSDLIESLKEGKAVRLNKVTVGSKNLIQLLRLLPGEYCQISANGRLEFETVRMVSRKNKAGHYKASFIRPKHYWHWFGIIDGAWLKPGMRINPVILKPRKFA